MRILLWIPLQQQIKHLTCTLLCLCESDYHVIRKQASNIMGNEEFSEFTMKTGNLPGEKNTLYISKMSPNF